MLETEKCPEEMVHVDLAMPAEVKEMITKAASIQRFSPEEFMVAVLRDAAEGIIYDHRMSNLSMEDQDALAAALLADEDDEPLSEGLLRLRRAMQEHSERVISK